MFTDTLNKVSQSLTFSIAHLRISRTTGFTLKSKTSDRLAYEEGPNIRELLLWIVRLTIVDPYLMLHNPNKLDHETQMSTFELINGLVPLIHDT